MKGSLRWPRPSFVCVICFLCGGCFITSWLRSKQRSPLTRCPILPCWGLHLAPPANSQSQVICTAQIEEQHTGVVNVRTSSATPAREAASSSFSVDDHPGSPFGGRSPAGVHVFPQSIAVSSTGKKQLKSAANTVAESPTSERISLWESLPPQDKSFIEGLELGGRLPFRYHRAGYENGKNTNLQSFFERDKPRFGHGSELGSPTSVARNGGGGVLDLLSPAHLLDPEDYADSLIAEVHGTFTEQGASTQQGINEKDAGVQSLLAEGTCNSTGNSGTGCDRKHSKRTNSDTSEVVRQRNQKVSTTAAFRSEKNPTAVAAIATRVEGVGEAFNEQEQSGCRNVKNRLGVSGGRASPGGFSTGPSFLETLQKVKRSRGTVGGRDVLYAHASVPFAFAQEAEVRTSSQLQQKTRRIRAAGALAADLTAPHVADVVSVRHADMPIAAHADALLQRSVSAGEDDEGNEATKGGKGGGADTGKIESKGKRHKWNSKSVLLQRGGAVLAPEKSHNNQRSREARTALDIARELNREHHRHRLQGASLLGTSSEIPAVKNVDTVTSQEKCAGFRAAQARETTKEAGRGRRPALVETAEGGGLEEEPEEEEEGEEFGESATAGEEEAAAGKGKAGETAEGKATPEAAAAAAAKEAAEKVGEVEPREEAASTKEHGETHAEVTEAAAAKKAAGAPEAPPAETGTTEVTETEIAPTTEIESNGEVEGEEEVSAEKGKEEAKPAKEHQEEDTEEKTVTVTIVTEGKKPGERPEKHEIVKKFDTGSKEAGKLVEKWRKIAEEFSEKHGKKEVGRHAKAEEKTEHKVGAGEEATEEAKKEAREERAEKLEETALERQHRAEKKLEEPAEMLEEHRLSRGGPRGVTPFRDHSYVNAQDELQHKQLQQASEMATRLTKHLQRQNELKVQEMHLKRREMAHINQLHHFEQALQAVISNVWKKLDTLRGSLQRMMRQTKVIGEKILRRTGHRVLRPEEAPVTLHPTPAERQQIVAKTSRGVPQGECPTDCLPSACDNKPATPTQCFKYTESAGGGGFRTCEPFSDPDTATCPRGFTRCAMAAPVRGSHYELFESTPERPLPQPLLIHGANLSACLRLLTVHEQTKCSPDSSQVVEETMKDAQSVRAQPAPHVLEENAVLFEDVQVPKVGNYKICLLQYWVPPGAKKGDKVYVLGIDEVGTLTVLPQPDDTVLAKLLKAEEERKEKEKAAKEKEEEGKDKEANDEKKEAHTAEERKEEKEKEVQEKMVEAATAGEKHAE